MALLVILLAFHSSQGLEAITPSEAQECEEQDYGLRNLIQGNNQEALAQCQEVLKSDPANIMALNNLGVALANLKRHDEAIKIFQPIIAREPEYLPAHFNVALLFMKDSKDHEAMEEFKRVLMIDGSHTASLYNLGVMHMRKGALEEAKEYFLKALKEAPDQPSLHYRLGTLLKLQGKTEEAMEELHRFSILRKKATPFTTSLETLETFIPAQAWQFVTYQPFASPALAHQEEREKPLFVEGTQEADLLLPPSSIPDPGGAGISLGDYDEDGLTDISVASRNALFRNTGRGSFEEEARETGVAFSGQGISSLFFDYDNDGDQDLFLINKGGNALYCNLGQGKFAEVTDRAGLNVRVLSSQATVADYDLDGDLDLFIANGKAASILYRNNGNETFTDITSSAGLGRGSHGSNGALFLDLDNDQYPDLVEVRKEQPISLYLNKGDGSFADISSRVAGDSKVGLTSLTAEDYDQDGDIDLYLCAGQKGPNLLCINDGKAAFVVKRGWPFAADIPEDLASSWAAGFFDYENDGDLDVFLTQCPADAKGLGPNILFLNEGHGQYAAHSLPEKTPFQAMAFFDYDSDGDTDMCLLSKSGTLSLLMNPCERRKTQWLKVKLIGTKANRDAIGSWVEVRAQENHQKRWLMVSQGTHAQGEPILHFGLGGHDKVDMVKVLWPDHIKHELTDQKARGTLTIAENPLQKYSCPLIYAWDGERFGFITDTLGSGFAGYLLAPGRYKPLDPDEYMRIEGHQLKPSEGRYLIRVVEQLEEVTFLDQLSLLAIDHKADVEVYPNEGFRLNPPFFQPEIHAVKKPLPPFSATDHTGQDVLDLLRKKDRIYLEGFGLFPFEGFAQNHYLELDLGPLPSREAVLLLHGWVQYPISSSCLAASQSGLSLEPPSLQVLNTEGQWVTLLKDMGFPAGLPKTMTLDLTNLLPPEARRIRIKTNMCIYWDEVKVASKVGEAEIEAIPLALKEAHLSFKGYPLMSSPDGKNPPTFDYHRTQAISPWKEIPGTYTRYGDVKELLHEADDMFVVMHHGDEVALSFDASQLPPLPEGWRRTFFLYTNGFFKDGDPNTAFSDRVEPLPFHAMSGYPYPEHEAYPPDEAHSHYRQRYNTRLVGEMAVKEKGGL